MKFDEIISHVGEFGPYQRRIYTLICVPAIAIGALTLATVFTMAIPDHRCALPAWPNDTFEAASPSHAAAILNFIPPGDDDARWSSCRIRQGKDDQGIISSNTSAAAGYLVNMTGEANNQTESCSRWVYDQSQYKSTLISQFDLVCEHKLGRSHAQMFFMLGSLCGTLFLGPPADYFGRRIVMMLSIVLQILSSVAIAFAPSFVFLCFFMMINGGAMSALYIVLFVIGMEMVGPSKRVYAGYIITIFFGFGVALLVLGAYLLRDWNHLQLAMAIGSLFFLAYYWLIPESPRWLVNKGRYSEANDILRKVAATNKKDLPAKMLRWEDMETEGPAQEPIWRILTYPRLVIRTLVIYFNWMVCSMVYYGISLNVADLAGNIYLNMLLYAIVEVIAIGVCVMLLNRVGRRRLHLTCMFVAGFCCAVSPFPSVYLGSDFLWVNIALAVLGKAGVSAAFATIWLYTSELFPTVVRNAGVSSSSLTARVGGIMAPYIANLSVTIESDLGRILPLLIFGLASLLAGALSLLLPETSGANLPDSLMDADTFGRKSHKKASEKLSNPSEMEALQTNTVV